MSSKRVRLAACTAGVLTAAMLALSTSPAAASGDYSGHAYVYGAETPVDDYGDEGILSTTRHRESNATCFWQKILWAEGYLNDWQVYGVFDQETEAATKQLQGHYGLDDDGVVGKNTFGAMDGKLRYVSGSYAPGQRVKLNFDGRYHDFEVIRDEEGRHSFYDYGGNYRHAAYNYRNCF